MDSLTGHTKLIEACPLVLHPKVSYPESVNPLLNSDHKTAETREEKMVEQKHLIKTFGRVQGVKFFEKKDSLKVEADQTEEKIMFAADNVKVDLLAPEPTQQPVDILPPRHDLAATKEQVYLVSDILSILEMKQLEEAGERVLAECRDKTETDRMVKTRLLSRLGGYLLYGCATSRRDPGHKPAILLYMEGIIKFSRLRPGDMAKGPKILQEFLPPSIGKKIFDTFSDGSRGAGNRLVTPELRDKALCYVIVLALLAGDFSIEMNLLSESVFAKSDHLKKLVAMVGAHMVSDTQKMAQFITLKLPLATFNINYVGMKKKGRKN